MSIYDNFLTSFKINSSNRKKFLFQPQKRVKHELGKAIEVFEHTKPVINFKHLLKDAVLDNMLDNNEFPLFYKSSQTNKNMKYFHLSQTFSLTEMNPEMLPQKPFLLIPLFKIVGPNSQDVNYKYFETDGYNQLQVLNDDGPCYLGAERWPTVQDYKLTLNIKGDVQVNLSQAKFVSNNGYLILKDHHSDCAMVYVGIFIDEGATKGFLNTKFGEIYKQYIHRNSQKQNNIQESNISLELEFNLAKFKRKEVYDSEDEAYILEYDRILGICTGFPPLDGSKNFKIILKGFLLNGELSFEVTKYLDEQIFDNGVCSLDFIKKKDVREYEKFVKKLKKSKRSRRMLKIHRSPFLSKNYGSCDDSSL